jgi:hypothetical protein
MQGMLPDTTAATPEVPRAPSTTPGLSPAATGFLVGITTGAVFFVIGFSGGEGPRLRRLTGNPIWVDALETLGALALVGGAVLIALRVRGRVGPGPVLSYVSGWCVAIAFTVAVAVFFDARSRLATFGLDASGRQDLYAGSQAALTRKSRTTLAVVDAFLSFIATFSVSFVILGLIAVTVRSVITAITKLLRLAGLLPPETMADF